jgi:hypothetical protein
MVRDAQRGLYSPFYAPTLHAYANAFVDAPSDVDVQRDFRRAFRSTIDAHLVSLGLTIDLAYVAALDLSIARAVRAAQAKSVEIVFNGDAAPNPAAARYPLLADAFPVERRVTRAPCEALRIEVRFVAYAMATKGRFGEEGLGTGAWASTGTAGSRRSTSSDVRGRQHNVRASEAGDRADVRSALALSRNGATHQAAVGGANYPK